jgi:stage II sporulation protein D
MTFFRPVVALTVLIVLVAASSAGAATRLVIRGGGFGHGVGMSQYGAMGFAQQGKGYRDILGHYYSDTAIGKLDAEPTVRVILQSGRRTVTFTGAAQAGDRRLKPGSTYKATSGGGQVVLRSATGRKLRTLAAPLRVVGASGAPVQLVGGAHSGSYRGAFELRPSPLGGVSVINALGLEDYVRGVVALESPSSWPAEALKAQAVAARTYAITLNKPGDGFDHYPDTRSQVYGGVAGERPTTDAAVAATAHEVVTYQGKAVPTYFFSTSGGRTENSEFGFPGGEAQPWLKSVEDPFDDVSPRHRWGPFRYTLSQAQRRLGSLVKGKLQSIEVTQRGRSPRVVAAQIVGTKGRTPVDGATLRRRFGLFDSWAYFTLIGTKVKPAEQPAEPSADPGSGAAEARAASAHRRATVTGRVTGVKKGAKVVVERRNRAGAWTVEVRTHLGKGGRYNAAVSRSGTYRIRVGSLVGPAASL